MDLPSPILKLVKDRETFFYDYPDRGILTENR